MRIDWKLNNELNEVWHFSFWLLFLFWQPKNWIFMAKKLGPDFFSKMQYSNFIQRCDFSFRFFNRSLAKSRRTAKRSTVLSRLLNILTNSIILRKIYFLSNFRMFFLRKMAWIEKFQVWMLMDWKLNYRSNEVWHSSFWPLLAFCQPRYWFFMAEKNCKK